MTQPMRLGVLQLNPTVGDLTGNIERLAGAFADAAGRGADLVIAPELAVTGYPPRDLLDRPSFVRDAQAALAQLIDRCRGPAFLVGAVVGGGMDPLAAGPRPANGALLFRDGAVLACHRKMLLPTYDVFDEARYFVAGETATVATLGGKRLGLSVCEDIWNDKSYWRDGPTTQYGRDPVGEAVALGADVLVNVSASPYDEHKPTDRRAMLVSRAKATGRPIVYVNQVGGNDSLIFDGRSLVLDGAGQCLAELPGFAEAVQLVDLDAPPRELSPLPTPTADRYEALRLGLADYVRKCGFRKVVLGLSGGIDSALTAALACAALGPDAVTGVAMPSRFSSAGSLSDAYDLGKRLGIRVDTVSIEPMFAAYLESLAPLAALPGPPPERDTTFENLQARIRGAILMAYSNRTGALLLTTGNKSEVAVGYCTLYGDMCGGLSLIADVYKTEVYALSRYINELAGSAGPIPRSSIDKAPSAELKANQTDQDSLPPYPLLDDILRAYVDGSGGFEDVVTSLGEAESGRGLDVETRRAMVRRVIGMVDGSEYKRRQAAPGLRVSRKAFGEGRRLPVAQGYRPLARGLTR